MRLDVPTGWFEAYKTFNTGHPAYRFGYNGVWNNRVTMYSDGRVVKNQLMGYRASVQTKSNPHQTLTRYLDLGISPAELQGAWIEMLEVLSPPTAEGVS